MNANDVMTEEKKGFFFIYDNARPPPSSTYTHIIHIRHLLRVFGCELFGYSPYSLDLAPSDFPLVPKMKAWFETQHSNDDKELYAEVHALLKSQAATFCNGEINKLAYLYDKCLNCYCYYVKNS